MNTWLKMWTFQVYLPTSLPWRHYPSATPCCDGEGSRGKLSITSPHKHQRDKASESGWAIQSVLSPDHKGLPVMTQTRSVSHLQNQYVHDGRQKICLLSSPSRRMWAWDCPQSSYPPTVDRSPAEAHRTSYVWGERANESNLDVPETRIHPWNSQFSELLGFLFA